MPPDDWGGRHAHLTYWSLIGLVGTQFFPENPYSVASACFAIGVWKEYKDYRKDTPGYKHGLFSRNDLKMDALGCGIGVVSGGFLIRLREGNGIQVGYLWELK